MVRRSHPLRPGRLGGRNPPRRAGGAGSVPRACLARPGRGSLRGDPAAFRGGEAGPLPRPRDRGVRRARAERPPRRPGHRVGDRDLSRGRDERLSLHGPSPAHEVLPDEGRLVRRGPARRTPGARNSTACTAGPRGCSSSDGSRRPSPSRSAPSRRPSYARSRAIRSISRRAPLRQSGDRHRRARGAMRRRSAAHRPCSSRQSRPSASGRRSS